MSLIVEKLEAVRARVQPYLPALNIYLPDDTIPKDACDFAVIVWADLDVAGGVQGGERLFAFNVLLYSEHYATCSDRLLLLQANDFHIISFPQQGEGRDKRWTGIVQVSE